MPVHERCFHVRINTTESREFSYSEKYGRRRWRPQIEAFDLYPMQSPLHYWLLQSGEYPLTFKCYVDPKSLFTCAWQMTGCKNCLSVGLYSIPAQFGQIIRTRKNVREFSNGMKVGHRKKKTPISDFRTKSEGNVFLSFSIVWPLSTSLRPDADSQIHHPCRCLYFIMKDNIPF